MPYLPIGTMRTMAKSLVNGEGQAIIFRRTTTTNNPTTGTPTTSNSDTALTAYVGARKRKFINGSLVVVPGERVLIAALDLALVPTAGDTVILGATEAAGIRRKVVSVRVSGAQGLDILYALEVE